uniref:Sulfotransferase n=1 Tax=Tetraselmis sp. GSL018 TaxID=582737 RepID=A0A061RXQ9_9CHLO
MIPLLWWFCLSFTAAVFTFCNFKALGDPAPLAEKHSIAYPGSFPARVHPDINIAGLAKSGTSHLHRVLAEHDSVYALQKEKCPLGESDVPRYHRELISKLELAPNTSHTLHSCLRAELAVPLLSHAKEKYGLATKPKFIILLRDPAE